NYAWLRDKSDPRVTAYLDAEEGYLQAVMKPTQAFQEKLYQEMLGRVQQTDLQVPYEWGGWRYYSRTKAGAQYQIYCRKRAGEKGSEEVILDLNELAKGSSFLDLGAYTVSPDGNLLAYTIDVAGDRAYKLFIKDLRSGALLADQLTKVTGVVWAEQ